MTTVYPASKTEYMETCIKEAKRIWYEYGANGTIYGQNEAVAIIACKLFESGYK